MIARRMRFSQGVKTYIKKKVGKVYPLALKALGHADIPTVE